MSRSIAPARGGSAPWLAGALVVLALAEGASGCVGDVLVPTAPGPEVPPPPEVPPENPGVVPPETPPERSLPASTQVVDTLALRCEAPDNPMPDIRRLSHLGYQAAVERFTGFRMPRDMLRAGLPPLLRDKTITNVEFGLRTGRVFTQRLVDLAHTIVEAMTWPAFFDSLREGCTNPTAGCRRGFVNRAFQRAVGRVPSDEERAIYLQVFDGAITAGQDFEGGARWVTEALLASPQFIFVSMDASPDEATEQGRADKARERAQRLSMLLYSEPNVPAVLERAAAGELETRAQVEGFVRAQLHEAQVSVGLQEFYYDWLNLDRLDYTIDLRNQGYPQYQLSTNDALREDVFDYLRRLVFVENKPFLQAFMDRRAVVRPETAWIYGAPELVAPTAPELVDLTAVDKRVGLLTMPAMASLTLKIETKSIVDRGVFVNEHILCRDIPLPNAVTPIDNTQFPENASQREKLAVHQQGACAGCHVMLDAPGFALEMFGPVGELSREDAWGNRLRDDGRFEIDGVETDFNDVYGFSELLAESDELVGCVVQRRLAHALARPVRHDDPEHRCELERLETLFRDSGFDIRELTVAIATSRYFID